MQSNEGHRRNGHGILTAGTEQVYEVERPPFDFICAALPGRQPNMHLQSCLERLKKAKLDFECKNCETGRYNRLRYLSGVEFKSEDIVRTCKCGEPVAKRCHTCADCQAANKGSQALSYLRGLSSGEQGEAPADFEREAPSGTARKRAAEVASQEIGYSAGN
jgi:hypothetical protein